MLLIITINYNNYLNDPNNDTGRFLFDQNFRLAFPKFQCTKWNGIFHQARSIPARGKFKMADLRTFLFLSEFFDDFEFTDDILEDDDDVVMFKKAIFF